MGFSLGAALGAKMGCPEKEVWVIVGDGGFQMCSMELATLVQEGVDMKIAVIRNGYLGMVRQWQEMLHNRRYSAITITSPDLGKLAEAYGVLGLGTCRPDEVSATIRRARQHQGPGAHRLPGGARGQRLPHGAAGQGAQRDGAPSQAGNGLRRQVTRRQPIPTTRSSEVA